MADQATIDCITNELECKGHNLSPDDVLVKIGQLLTGVADTVQNGVPVTQQTPSFDTELVCASTDGRILRIEIARDETGNVTSTTLSELDGSAIADGATAVQCAGGGGAATPASSTSSVVLFDEQGGVLTPFLRLITQNPDGTFTVLDRTLDGVTPYTVVGAVVASEPSAAATPAAPVTAATTTAVRFEFTAAPSPVKTGIPNAQSVTFVNVGDQPGTVSAAPLLPGESVSFEAYFDPVTNEFKRLNPIPVEADNTTIHAAYIL